MRNLLVLALAFTAPQVAARAGEITLRPEILTAAQRSQVPTFARNYTLKASADGRIYLYTRAENAHVYAIPEAWTALRYRPGTGEIGEPTGAVGDLNFGVELPSDKPLGTFDTNMPGYVPPVDPPGAAGPTLETVHPEHASGSPCPGPGPCPNPSPDLPRPDLPKLPATPDLTPWVVGGLAVAGVGLVGLLGLFGLVVIVIRNRNSA